MNIDEGGMYPLFGVGDVVAFNPDANIAYPRSYISFAIPWRFGWLSSFDHDADLFGRRWIRFVIRIQGFPDTLTVSDFHTWQEIRKPLIVRTLLEKLQAKK